MENAWIVKNGYITVDEIRNSDMLSTKLPTIQNIIYSFADGATAFNRSFDFDFLENRGIRFPNKLPCPMLLSTDLCKLPSSYGKPGYKWPKVEEAWKYFFPEVEYVELHRGADDAFHEADIVYALHKLGLIIKN